MAIWKAWALTPRVLVNGRWEMQLVLDFPNAGAITDDSGQLDADAHLLPLALVVGIAPSDAALNAVKANANHLVLAQIQVDDLNGDQITTPRNTTLDDLVTAPQVTAFTNYLTAHGINITKYNLNTDLAVGKTRLQVLTALRNKIQRWLA
jgi:hypothetical protein